MVVDPTDNEDQQVEKPYTKREEKVLKAFLALLSEANGTDLEKPDSVSKKPILEWLERNGGETRESRRGVAFAGLKGLKERGLIGQEGDRIFLLRALP